eukprot:1792903-Amphidinium_carterae.2
MNLDDPIPAPGDASSGSGVTEVKQEPHNKTTWKRTLRSMDTSTVIELDSPTHKKQQVETDEASDHKILTEQEENATMAASDLNSMTLSQELEQLMRVDETTIAELADLAPDRD